MGSLEEGAQGGSVPRLPAPRARSTALKSCEVCHRTASPRMRIGKVDFFLPPTPLCLSSRVWFCNFKKVYIFFSAEYTRGKRSLERGRAKVRELAGSGGTRSPRAGAVSLQGTASHGKLLQAQRRRLRRPESSLCGRCFLSSFRRLLRAPLPPLGPQSRPRRWAASTAMDLWN